MDSNRHGWRAIIYQSIREFESSNETSAAKTCYQKVMYVYLNNLIHSKEYITCEPCGRIYLSKAGLMIHLRRHVDPIPDAPNTHLCVFCSRVVIKTCPDSRTTFERPNSQVYIVDFCSNRWS